MDRGKQIYENITRIAYEQGRTLNEVCRNARVSHGIISDLKHGRRSGIGDVTIQRLMHTLNCRREDILADVEGAILPDPPKAKRTEASVDRMLDQLRDVLMERKELRKLLKAALKATDKQVHSTAVLLEAIIDASERFDTNGKEDNEEQ